MDALAKEIFSLDPHTDKDYEWQDICDIHHNEMNKRCGSTAGVECLFEVNKVCEEQFTESKKLFKCIKLNVVEIEA